MWREVAANSNAATMLEPSCAHRHRVLPPFRAMRASMSWLRKRAADSRMGSCTCSLPLPHACQVYALDSDCFTPSPDRLRDAKA